MAKPPTSILQKLPAPAGPVPDLGALSGRPTALIMRYEDGAFPVFAAMIHVKGKPLGLWMDKAQNLIWTPSANLMATFLSQCGYPIMVPEGPDGAAEEGTNDGNPVESR